MLAATPAGASPVPVSPPDGATISTTSAGAYTFDTGATQGYDRTWRVNYSTSAALDGSGQLGADLGSAYAPEQASAPDRKVTAYLGPSSAGVVYWQVRPSCSDPSNPGCGPAGPVWRVTIAQPSIGPTGIAPAPVAEVPSLPDPIEVVFSDDTERTFTVEKRVPYVKVRCSLDCTATITTQVTARGKRRTGLDLQWPKAQLRANKTSVALHPTLTASLRKRIARAMGRRGTARLKTMVVATDAYGRTDRDTLTLTFKHRARPSPMRGGSGVPSKPTLVDGAEAAANRALKDRNLITYFISRCDRIGPSEFDCIARSTLGSGAYPDRHATVRRVGSKWYVGTFYVMD